MAGADDEIKAEAVKHGIIAIARGQVGAHYVLGAAGATPGNTDGAWYRLNGVKLHGNETKRDGDRTRPILFTATYTGKSACHVCAGRCDNKEVKARPEGDPENLLHTLRPDGYLWERPDRKMDAAKSVFGESCVGKRHFDCIGFINWVLGNVQQKQWSIASWVEHTEEVPLKTVAAGDVLTTSDHIGLATDKTTVVHASDTHVGVIETKISAGGWKRCGRLKASFWLRYKLEPGTIDFDVEDVDVIRAD
jgi:cell wall-associated NlpC family hydrolase